MITDKQVEVALSVLSEINIDKEAMRAALEAAEQAAWQPIENAPKGVWVDVSFYGVNVRACWSEHYKTFTTIADDPIYPTHWRPLPEPPKE